MLSLTSCEQLLLCGVLGMVVVLVVLIPAALARQAAAGRVAVPVEAGSR